MANWDIGIKNSFKLYQTFIIAAFVAFCVLTVVFWILVQGEIYNNNLLYNGIEVEAEIVDWYCIDTTPDEIYATHAYEGVYLYVSPEGKEYSGSCGLRASTEKDAQSKIGTKINIVIDPHGTDSTTGMLAGLALYKDNIHTDFPCACVFTVLLLISAYLFFYRYVYRNKLDKKILNMMRLNYTGSIVDGEVVKIFGLIWFYVKVRYIDKNGKIQTKWARSWFARKEAKFLQDKKTIKIVLYKNTYGVLEEMS